MKEALLKEIMEIGGDIISSDRFRKARKVPHHSKSGNIARHCLETAGYALLLARWLGQRGITVSEVDVVRASLLHDIGMTEDFVFLSSSHKKARLHPSEGARIAAEEYGANEVQVKAIQHHMWPVCCYVPPNSVVGWVLTVADKCCSVHEVGRSSEAVVDTAGRWLLRVLGSH
ncbi:MAG: HDIG domain-containing protein [Atopobiaceae bacterium]|nr:HDIG domain-containing protein [Atopobiaceae bacterium]